MRNMMEETAARKSRMEKQGHDLSGNEAAFAPNVKFNGVLRYEWPVQFIKEGNMALSFNWSWTDDVFHDVRNNPLITAEDVWLVGGRLSYTTVDVKVELGLWSQNLADVQYRVQSFDFVAFGSVTHVPNKPRSFGIDITYNW